jgi:hypothetical protein
MVIQKLRNHIPIATSARREPADGTESPMRVTIGFVPSWFHSRLGINFSETWHTYNWDVTPYFQCLQKLPNMGYLDFGIMSYLSKVKAAFPYTRRAVLYSPVVLTEASIKDIQCDMEKI